MTDSETARKTFFSQWGWGPPTFICGMLVVLGIYALLFRHGAGFGCTAPIILGILLWFCFFCRIRFEQNYAVLYYCTIFPVKVDYSQIVCAKYFCREYKKISVPVSIVFYLDSGKRKYWNINFFSLQTAQSIKSELEKRIDSPENRQTIPDIDWWADNLLRPSAITNTFLCLASIFTFFIGTHEMTKQLMWNDHIKNWDKVDGIILKNTTKRVSSGKSSKKVADVEYKYTYKGRQYLGTKIVYDSSTFPDLRVGSRWQVIVNPEKPQECAIMFWYRGYWKFIRWIECSFYFLESLVFAIFFIKSFLQKKITIPETLKNYINSIPPERFYAALNTEQPEAVLNCIELEKEMKYSLDLRYGIIKQTVSIFTYIIWGILTLIAGIMTVFSPLGLVILIVIGFAAHSLYSPRMTVFDFHEKKFFCCKRFDPEKTEQMKALSFADIDHLCCNTVSRYIGVFAVTHDGHKLPLFKVTKRNLELLFKLLPELADKIGHLPITF